VRTEARFPSIPPDAGHYESFYLKAAAPEGGRSVWIRHTVHQRPNRPPTGALWMTWFDTSRGAPVAAKQQVAAAELSVPDDSYIRVAESEIAPGRAQGQVATDGVEASWNLRFTDFSGPLRHFPSPWMYERPLPRTKLLSPHPCVTFDGILEVGDERIELAAWPGMVGHNWGAEHAETWIWIHGATIDDDGTRGYVDLGGGRVKVGPLLTPWVINGEILHRGERLRVGGLGKLPRTRVETEPTRCELTAAGSGLVARASIVSPRSQVVGWIYADPVGPDHHSLNCSVADLDLVVERRRGADFAIRVEGAATYELGTRRTDHGIPLQPFADG
jgi:hypothetical protein